MGHDSSEVGRTGDATRFCLSSSPGIRLPFHGLHVFVDKIENERVVRQFRGPSRVVFSVPRDNAMIRVGDSQYVLSKPIGFRGSAQLQKLRSESATKRPGRGSVLAELLRSTRLRAKIGAKSRAERRLSYKELPHKAEFPTFSLKMDKSPAVSTGASSLSAQDLDRYRSYLQMLARAEIAPRIRRRVEPSDIVQQTLFEAFQKRDHFRGRTDDELSQWLRQMLLHNVLDATRALRRQKRDIGREKVLGTMLQDSSSRLADLLAADHTSPSQQASNTEQVLRMADAISELPQDQQDAVVLHHLQGKSLAELATILDRSQTAVAGLLYRGLKRLRGLLSQPDQYHDNE